MRGSYSAERGRSIRQMTGTSLDPSPKTPRRAGQHIASGQFFDDGHGGGGTTITRVCGERTTSLPTMTSLEEYDENSYNSDAKPPRDDSEGYEEETVSFPQSTHSWLFTQDVSSLPFWVAVGIAVMSYLCLSLALFNIFEEYEPGNPFDVPYHVFTSVRIAQYLALVIAMIMEEEIPTGLYLLRIISKESLHTKFPKMQFGRFVISAIVRLGMGYLFLLNTFCIVVRATAVLDIFYDVIALQFLQQLDDIAFNLAKTDVFGIHMKRAALSKCFRAEFERQPFALRKKMNFFLKGIFALNLCLLLAGMGWITHLQSDGAFYAREITVTFGEQIWPKAIATLPSGDDVTRTLLFSYFNGVYRFNGTQEDGTPIYMEQNKFDGTPYVTTKGATIRYCKREKVWAFTHVNIRKNENSDELECPWLLRSPETSEFNLLDVTGDWSIWTGTLQPNGYFSTVDNECHEEVDCNYNGICKDGKCDCSDEYYGTHCEHKAPCSLMHDGGKGAVWAQIHLENVEVRIYERPVYVAKQGIPPFHLHMVGINPAEDDMVLMYTGSRWLGAHYPGSKAIIKSPRWQEFMREFHAFWENTYNNKTRFLSDPTTQSSIIGVDFYSLDRQGEEFGPFGELYPQSIPKGSGFMRCVEDNPPPDEPGYDINYLDVTANSSVNGIDMVVKYEIGKDRDYESDAMAWDCANQITGIDLNLTHERSPKNGTHDWLSLKYSWTKSQLAGSNIWNATSSNIELCQLVRLIFPATNSTPKMVIIEDKQTLDVNSQGK